MIFDDDYWIDRKKRVIAQAIEILEDDFRITVSRGDRIFVNKYAQDIVSEWKKLPSKIRMD